MEKEGILFTCYKAFGQFCNSDKQFKDILGEYISLINKTLIPEFLLKSFYYEMSKCLRVNVNNNDSTQMLDLKHHEDYLSLLLQNENSFKNSSFRVIDELLTGITINTTSCNVCGIYKADNSKFCFIPLDNTDKNRITAKDTYEICSFFIFYNIKNTPIKITLKFFDIDSTVMSLRYKIAKVLGIHPFSFLVIKFNEDGNMKSICSSDKLLYENVYILSPNEKPYFLFEIDPQLFYSWENKYFLTDGNYFVRRIEYSTIFSHQESDRIRMITHYSKFIDVTGKTQGQTCYYSKQDNIPNMEININMDNNYGFSSDYLELVLEMKYGEVNEPKRLLFPRLLVINKFDSNSMIYKMIFNYFKIFLCIEDLNELNFHKLPFLLRIVSRKSHDGICYFCNLNDCKNCLFPMADDIRIVDYLNLIKEKVHSKEEVDNTFYFLNNSHNKLISNHDFSLEIIWNEELRESIRRLNDKIDLEISNRSIKNINDSHSNKLIDAISTHFQTISNLDCVNCSTPKSRIDTLRIIKFPQMLILKVKSDISFPLKNLNLTNFSCIDDENHKKLYNLFAIIDYESNLTITKNYINNCWNIFSSNSNTTLMTDDDDDDAILKAQPSYLFYRLE